jgi:membrane protein DedA with SNARE-associated domain
MMPWDDFYKYVGVFTALVVSAFGVPIPEELPIITGGVLVGKEWDNPNSWMKWWLMLPVCIAGVVVCDTILYVIGRKWGAKLLKRKWVQRHILAPEKRDKIEKNFHDYGIAILLVARLLPGIRSPMFIMSGVMKLPFRKFIIADMLYAIPGVNLLFWLSYWFTDQFLRAFQKVEGNRPLITAVVLAAVSGFLAYQFLIKRRVTTGDPEELPVIGKQVATISHQLHVAHEKHHEEPAAGGGAPPPPEPHVPSPHVTDVPAKEPEKM